MLRAFAFISLGGTLASARDGMHLLACGRKGKCENELKSQSHCEVDYLGRHEVRCCMDDKPSKKSLKREYGRKYKPKWKQVRKFKKQRGCGVYAASKLPRCVHAASFEEAKHVCDQIPGARLCSADEIENGCGKGTGCGHDKDLLWTSNSCTDHVLSGSGCDERLHGHENKDYRGCQTITRSGKLCQRWDSQEPHSHSRTPKRYSKSGLVENYCRNPDGEDTIWCYTTDDNDRWDYCDPVPLYVAPTEECGFDELINFGKAIRYNPKVLHVCANALKAKFLEFDTTAKDTCDCLNAVLSPVFADAIPHCVAPAIPHLDDLTDRFSGAIDYVEEQASQRIAAETYELLPYIDHLKDGFEQCKMNLWQSGVPDPILMQPYQEPESCGLGDAISMYKAVKNQIANQDMLEGCMDLAGVDMMDFDQVLKEACECLELVHAPEFVEAIPDCGGYKMSYLGLLDIGMRMICPSAPTTGGTH